VSAAGEIFFSKKSKLIIFFTKFIIIILIKFLYFMNNMSILMTDGRSGSVLGP